MSLGRKYQDLNAALYAQSRPPLKAVVYGRSACGLPDEDTLVAAAIETADNCGFEIVGVYSDNGVSGALRAGGRSEFAALKKRVGGGEADVIVVQNLETLGRDPFYLAEVLVWIHVAGVGLLTVDHGWMRSPQGTLAPDPRQ